MVGADPPVIPQSWKDSWLFFLPKPGKPNTHPEQMRPISLMEPLGKLVMGLLTTELKKHILGSLCRHPQFGFLPLRAATDAIMRVAAHSKSIRELVHAHRRTVRNQIANPVGTVICGGLSLFLDLNRAFDCADRTAILDHLLTLGAPPNLVQIVASWHEDTHYNLVFRGDTTSIPVGRGLRQGCKIAPLLWVSYMDLFMSRLSIRTGRQWIQENLTIYADDVHIGCLFMSASALREHLTNIGHALDVIESLKLSLSYSKSYMMIAYTGTNPRSALKGVLHKTPAGTSIRIPRTEGQPTTLPLKNKGSYLGVTLSYNAHEQLAWNHRKHAGWLAFARLRPWLRNRQIPQSKRLYLWKTCVYTVMTYGILASNVTLKVLTDYQVVVYRMIRIILGDHAFISHRTHQQVFQHFHLAHPLDMLQDLAMALLLRIQRRTSLIPPDDFLHRLTWTHLPDVIQLIRHVRANAPEVPVSADASAPVNLQASQRCPFCPFQTGSSANLRRHMTAQHAAPIYRVSQVFPLSMALQGKPQCTQCLHLFTSRKIFFVHVQRDCCQVQPRPMTEPPDVRPRPLPAPEIVNNSFQITGQPFWPDLQSNVLTDDWHGLSQQAPALEYLTHHCAICGTWCNRFQEMHGHYRLYHHEQLRGGVAKGVQLSHVMQHNSPCPLCQKSYHRVHSCPVTLQIGILRLQLMEPDVRSQAELTCEICVQQFDDTGQLYSHMAQTHGHTLNDWVPSRDSVYRGLINADTAMPALTAAQACDATSLRADARHLTHRHLWIRWTTHSDGVPGFV